MSQTVTMPDGQVHVFPDGVTPEQISTALSQLSAPAPSTMDRVVEGAKKYGFPVIRGALQSAQGLLNGLGAGELDPKTMAPVEPPLARKLREYTDKNFPEQEGLVARGLEGVGQTVGGGPRTAIAGALSNIAGSSAQKALEAAGAPKTAQTAGSVAAALLTGVGSGFALAPRQGAADQAIRRSTAGLDLGPGGADYHIASQNAAKYASSGATTGTLPELLPGNNRLLSLALEARRSRGGEKLSAQVNNREADLQALTNRAVEQSGPPVVPAEVANRARTAGENVINKAMSNRSKQYQLDLAGVQDLPPAQVDALISVLKDSAKNTQSQVERDAYSAAIDSLTSAQPGTATVTRTVASPPIGKKGFRVANATETAEVPTPQPKTSIQAIARDLKQMQENANSLTQNGGQKLNSAAVSEQYKAVQDFLKSLSAPYRKAEANYASTSANVVDPLVGGPIGDVAGRNPRSLPDPNASVLNNLIKDQTPESIPGVLATLQSGDQLPSNLLPKIARTLVEQRVQNGTLNPGQAIRGLPGSLKDRNLQAVLESANLDSYPLKETLDVADMLQTPQFRSAVGTTGEAPVTTVGLRIPNASRIAAGLADRFLGTNLQNKYYEKISALLSDPSQEALDKLRKIAMFDPKVRQLMALRAAAPTVMKEGQ